MQQKLPRLSKTNSFCCTQLDLESAGFLIRYEVKETSKSTFLGEM